MTATILLLAAARRARSLPPTHAEIDAAVARARPTGMISRAWRHDGGFRGTCWDLRERGGRWEALLQHRCGRAAWFPAHELSPDGGAAA